MSFQIVSERLAVLQESNTQLRNLINRLANIKFQPGSVPLGSEDDNVKVELADEIQQTIAGQEDDLKVLQEDVIDFPPMRPGTELDEQKNALDRGVKRAIKEVNELVIEFRKAQITAKKGLQKAQRLERALIAKSYLAPKPADQSQPLLNKGQREKKSQNLSQDEKTVNASTDVTLALRRTHDMMAAELSRSQFAREALDQSTQALADLGENYSTLDTMLSSSKNLLGTLLRSQKSDTWYLETAFYVLAVTIAWLVFRRLIYGPSWWLVYQPLKIVFNAWIGVFTAVGLIGGSKQVVNSSIARGETSILGSASATILASGAPSIVIGGGSPVRASDNPQGEGGLSDQVGRIISDSQAHEAEDGQQDESTDTKQAGVQMNPKKRIWEEEIEAPKEAQRRRDEL